MSGVGGYSAWRWIFILEGLITIVVAAFGKYFIVDWPENAKFLTSNERQLLSRRLQMDVSEAKMDYLDKKAWRRILSDWKIYVGFVPPQRSIE